MRKAGIIIALFLGILSVSFGQQVYDGFSGLDTLANNATGTYASTENFKSQGTLEYHVAIDSLSGTPAGTIYYEYSLSPAGVEWYAAGTDTIANAAETSAQFKVVNFVGSKARIRVVTGAGAQSIEVTPYLGFRKD